MEKAHKKFIDIELAEKVALRIKELRDTYGHTQEFLIEKLHLDINRYEICDRIPTLMSLRKICEFYNISLSDFFMTMNYPPKTEKIVERMSVKK
ncbi:helix-turn-helix transcriptional regulator [uncultured Alistipes sp.]|uniref:helix-turn-helix domain-containing protein n=1 Tax=uncultured Alistipes sp. TaxID=538949 RepID=UPI00262EEA08|nr:helix-turn-helix transcriptional regulator [uncultured Alistipes sp.]